MFLGASRLKVAFFSDSGNDGRLRRARIDRDECSSDASSRLGSMAGLQGLSDTSEHVCIKMRGLPYNAGQREIMDFFEGYNILPNGIHIVMGATDRPTGEAFVEFITSDEAQRAMERHRQNIGSRYIELFRATKRFVRLLPTT